MVFFPYAKQSINEQDLEAVTQALQAETITRGERVDQFEKAIAQYCDATYAVAFNSGSTALAAACFAAEMNKQDRFITSPNTFIASATCGLLRQSTPVFIDIDRTTGSFDLNGLEPNLQYPFSSRGKTVVIPVHFAGIAMDMQKLDQMIQHDRVVVIEDAAHALGSYYPDGKKVGSCAWSQMTIFSFHPAKVLTTGEGGIVTTNDVEYYSRLKHYRNNGIEKENLQFSEEMAPWYYEAQALTGNYNFTEFQAALGLSQLNRIESFIDKRRQLVRYYRKRLQNIPFIETLTDQWDNHSAFHLFPVQIDFAMYKTDRQTIMKALQEQGVGTQVHYIPLYRHPAIQNLTGNIVDYFPQMEIYYQRALSLPLYYDLTEENIDQIVAALKQVLNV